MYSATYYKMKIKMIKNYTETELKFLTDNYPSKGAKYCSEILNKKPDSIKYIANTKLKLKITKKVKLKTVKEKYKRLTYKNSVPFENFQKINTPEHTYILGFIWADGCIFKNRIAIECVQEDLETLEHVFMETGKWDIYYRTRPNRKPQMGLRTENKYLAEYLFSKGYTPNGRGDANLILDTIPEHLKHYWYRGLSDGDGCFYLNTKNNTRQYTLAGALNTDWDFIVDLFKNMNITYNTQKTINLIRGSSSNIRICNASGILQYSNFIYKNYPNDKIGLKRKYDKFIDIVKSYLINNNNKDLIESFGFTNL